MYKVCFILVIRRSRIHGAVLTSQACSSLGMTDKGSRAIYLLPVIFYLVTTDSFYGKLVRNGIHPHPGGIAELNISVYK